MIPFAFLINNQRDTVLSLLEASNVQDRSSLDILIHTWCENAETFQGFWPTRISTLALSQLYTAERQSLQNLMVKGDIIVKPETQNGGSSVRFYLSSPCNVEHNRVSSHYDQITNEDKYEAIQCARDIILNMVFVAPHEFTSIPFPVKALKILVHDLRTNGESAALNGQNFDVDSDDGVSSYSYPVRTAQLSTDAP